MCSWLRRGAAGCAVGALALLPAPRSQARPVLANPLMAWAMPGHDPQRTAQGTGLGPRHASTPRLVLKGLYSNPPIVGSDGALYGFLDIGTRHARVAAVEPGGHVRWSATAALPGWWNSEPPDPYPVLAHTGAVSFGGGACPRPLSSDYSGTAECLTTVGPDGRPRGHVITYGLTKGGPRLLVAPDGALVRATIGPYSGFTGAEAADDAQRNVTVFAPDGSSRRLGAGCAWANTALGVDGTLYAATLAARERQACLPANLQRGQSSSIVVAFAPTGARIWAAPLPAECEAATLAADRGRVYISASCAGARVFALDAHGRVLWTVHGTGGGYPALAVDRAGGDLWLADVAGVKRVTPTGAVRWWRAWRPAAGDRVTLSLDAGGAAYMCGGDGRLRALGPDGQVLWQRRLPAPRYGFTAPPSTAIGPDGTLFISGADERGIIGFAP